MSEDDPRNTLVLTVNQHESLRVLTAEKTLITVAARYSKSQGRITFVVNMPRTARVSKDGGQFDGERSSRRRR